MKRAVVRCLIASVIAGPAISSAAAAEPGQKPAVATWTAPARAASRPNPVPADTTSIARGKDLYVKECAVCHGMTGTGDGPKAPELRVNPGDFSSPATAQQSDGALFWKITRGRTPMPAYRARFSDRERWMLVNYLRVLAGQPAVAEKTPAQAERAATAKAKPAEDAPTGTGPYVSRQEYQQLKAAHDKLRQELEVLKAQLGVPTPKSAAPPGTNSPAAAAAEPVPEPAEAEELETRIRQALPGSTKLLVTGSGAAGYAGRRRDDSAFSAEFRPIFLWQLSERLFFESIILATLDDDRSNFDLETAQISYLLNDYLTLGAGKFLSPMNYFQERVRPGLINKLPDKPLAVHNGALPETSVGIQVRGAVPISGAKLEYALYAANAPRLVTDDRVRAGVLEFDNFNNRGGHVAVGGRIGFFPIPELGAGYGFQVSGAGSRPERADTVLHSVDLNYFRGSRMLKGTINLLGQWVWSEVDSLTYDPAGGQGFGPLNFNNRRNGGYVQVAYRPNQVEHELIKRLEAVLRYDRFNQRRTPVGFNQQRWTFGLNYWLGPNAVLKAAYQFDDSDRDELDDAFLFQFVVGL